MNVIDLFPPQGDVVEVSVSAETFSYAYSSRLDEYGDREVVDVSRKSTFLVQAQRITFLQWIETLIRLERHGVPTIHQYAKQLDPDSQNQQVWHYFDRVNGNFLTNGTNVKIFVFWIEDVGYFAVLRLLTRQELALRGPHL